jgi:hypothetical protein
MSFTCKSCTKNFKSKYSLERHNSCCKGQPIINDFKCKYCPKAYTRKWYLQQHEKTCEDKDKVIEILQLKLENQLLKQNNSKTVNSHNTTTNSNNVTNNNIINNYSFYGMEPLDLSQKRFDSIVEDKYTYEKYLTTRLVPDIILKFLSNDQDKIVALLTDYNRMKIKCINENLEVETHDPETLVNFCKKSKPMNSKVIQYIDKAGESGHQDEINRNNFLRTDANVMASSLRSYRNNFLHKKKKAEKVVINFIEE